MVEQRTRDVRTLIGSPRGFGRAAAQVVAVGMGLGLFSVLADGVAPVRALTLLGNIIAPWILVAFVVGRRSSSPRHGAWAGTVALAVGVVTYYVLRAARFGLVTDASSTVYLLDAQLLVWLVAAVTVGPAIGWAGAASRRPRSSTAAVVAPGILLVAEAGFLVLDRRPWLWDLVREPYRLADVAIFVGMIAVAAALPSWLIDDPRRRRRAYLTMIVVGAAGTVALRVLDALIVAAA